MRSAYETPALPCPYCGTPCEADWCDVGVGMVQSGPYHCVSCYACEAGPHCKTDRDDYDPETGWFKPGSPPGSSANVGPDGRPIGYKEADTLYRATRGVSPRYK